MDIHLYPITKYGMFTLLLIKIIATNSRIKDSNEKFNPIRVVIFSHILATGYHRRLLIVQPLPGKFRWLK